MQQPCGNDPNTTREGTLAVGVPLREKAVVRGRQVLARIRGTAAGTLAVHTRTEKFRPDDDASVDLVVVASGERGADCVEPPPIGSSITLAFGTIRMYTPR